jgi:uncharacterized glyoxalase superfamily protein PhnB
MSIYAARTDTDVKAAIRWLDAAFGLKSHTAGQDDAGDDGQVHHAVLTSGEGMVMAESERVGAGNCVTSCDLDVFVNQAAEPVPPQNADARAFCRWILAPGGRVLVQRPEKAGQRCSAAGTRPSPGQVVLIDDQQPVEELLAQGADGPGTDWQDKPDAPPFLCAPSGCRFGRQAPGPGSLARETTSGSYSFRRAMRLETMGGSLR